MRCREGERDERDKEGGDGVGERGDIEKEMDRERDRERTLSIK